MNSKEHIRHLLNKFDEINECECEDQDEESLDVDLDADEEELFEIGIMNTISKTASGAATGASLGRFLGPTGAVAGAAIGGISGFKDSLNDEEIEEDLEENDNSRLQQMMDDSGSSYQVIEAREAGTRRGYTTYEVLANDDGVYVIVDVMIKDGVASVMEVDYSSTSLNKAMYYFDLHVDDLAITEDAFNVEMPAEELKGSVNWLRKPNKLSDIDDIYSVNSSVVAKDIPQYFDDEVFPSRLEAHENVSNKTFKNPLEDDVFVMDTHFGKYLIRTDGADYIRYAALIVDDTLEDPEFELDEKIDHSVPYDDGTMQYRKPKQKLVNNFGDNSLEDDEDFEENYKEKYKNLLAEWKTFNEEKWMIVNNQTGQTLNTFGNEQSAKNALFNMGGDAKNYSIKSEEEKEKPFVSPYLERPLRSEEQARRDIANSK